MVISVYVCRAVLDIPTGEFCVSLRVAFKMYFILDHVSSLSSERYIIGKSSTPILHSPSAQSCVGAAVACFVWDFILTFHDEVEYIWKRWRWEASRFCFFWTRYSGLGCFLYAAYRASSLNLPFSWRKEVPELTFFARSYKWTASTGQPAGKTLSDCRHLGCQRC